MQLCNVQGSDVLAKLRLSSRKLDIKLAPGGEEACKSASSLEAAEIAREQAEHPVLALCRPGLSLVDPELT